MVKSAGLGNGDYTNLFEGLRLGTEEENPKSVESLRRHLVKCCATVIVLYGGQPALPHPTVLEAYRAKGQV